ncbi:MAG: gliding motility protein GldM [Bacteroidales bacterium]|nr:gliding motility protein GldM [Bacteroidales bacterium]
MGHGKETPRQKMIGMMYLVLTALLALNVSKDVLDAFVIVDHGLHETTKNFFSKNKGIYGKIDLEFTNNPEKAGAWKERSDEVKNMSQEIIDFIQNCKLDIVRQDSDEAIKDGEVIWENVKARDNQEWGGEIMVTNGKGKELKGMIEEYRETMIEMIDNSEGDYSLLISSIEGNLETADHQSEKKGEADEPWEKHNFEHLPLAAVITILSELQSDIRNVESDMATYLLNQVGAKDFKVNVIDPVILPTSSDYVFVGQEYRAEVFLAGYDSTNIPEIILNDGTVLDVEEGKGIYTATSLDVGEKTWGGTLRLNNDGQIIQRDFTATYSVNPTNAAVSAERMNVFFRGVDNPVKIVASGVPESTVYAEISEGDIEEVSNGNYIVRPGPREKETVISVFANVDGNVRNMGSAPFRVEDIPDPIATVEGLDDKAEGVLSVADLARLRTVEAKAKDFFFEVNFTVESFEISWRARGGLDQRKESENEAFTAEQFDVFTQQLRPGQQLLIRNIKASGPAGKIRELNPIIITII